MRHSVCAPTDEVARLREEAELREAVLMKQATQIADAQVSMQGKGTKQFGIGRSISHCMEGSVTTTQVCAHYRPLMH